jgi:hypothetical protein
MEGSINQHHIFIVMCIYNCYKKWSLHSRESFCKVLWIKKISFQFPWEDFFYYNINDDPWERISSMPPRDIPFIVVAQFIHTLELSAKLLKRLSERDCRWPIVHDKWPQIESRAILCVRNEASEKNQKGEKNTEKKKKKIKCGKERFYLQQLKFLSVDAISSESEKCHSSRDEKTLLLISCYLAHKSPTRSPMCTTHSFSFFSRDERRSVFFIFIIFTACCCCCCCSVKINLS